MNRNNFARWFIVMVLIVVSGGTVYYFTDTTELLQQQKEDGTTLFTKRVIPIVAEKVAKGDIAVTVGSIGTITASESSEIYSELSGHVDWIGFQEGQSVKEGDILLEIDSAPIHVELDKAQTILEQAQIAAGQGGPAEATRLEQAKATVDALNARLAKTQIAAPFDGVVGLRNFSLGNIVQPGQILTNIDALDPMSIEFSVPEKNFSDVHEGQEVTFTVDAYPDLFFKGEIYAIDSRVDPKTRSFQVKAMVGNTENTLRSGMYARLQIPVSVHSDVIVIPDSAVLVTKDETGEKPFVFVIEKDRVVKTPVVLGIRQGDLIEILSGITPDQNIAVSNVAMLHNHSKISIEQQQQPPASPTVQRDDSDAAEPDESDESAEPANMPASEQTAD